MCSLLPFYLFFSYRLFLWFHFISVIGWLGIAFCFVLVRCSMIYTYLFITVYFKQCYAISYTVWKEPFNILLLLYGMYLLSSFLITAFQQFDDVSSTWGSPRRILGTWVIVYKRFSKFLTLFLQIFSLPPPILWCGSLWYSIFFISLFFSVLFLNSVFCYVFKCTNLIFCNF